MIVDISEEPRRYRGMSDLLAKRVAVVRCRF